MGKGADGCGELGGMLGAPGMEEILAQEAIKSVLDFKQDRIMVYTVKPEDIPDGWGLAPGFENYPSAVGGTNARWQVLVPYLLENYPDDFQLIHSGGIAEQEDGSALMASPGSQYLGVRTVYPFDHPRAGQPTDGLLTVHNWVKGDGVQGELREKLDRALENYKVRHFKELVSIRARRALGTLEKPEGAESMLIDDLPEDWEEQLCNAVLHMPPVVWNDHNGFRDIYGNTGKGSKAGLEGYTHSWRGSDIEKPVHQWNFNDDNRYVTTDRLQAAAAWCGFLKDCDPPMVILPNLVDKDEPLTLAKDDQGKLVPATGRRQTPQNYPADKAKTDLEKRGLRVETQGSGEYVIAQDPPVMGQRDAIQPGGKVTLTLGDKADWRREYVDSIPSQEDRHRRQSSGFISQKQEKLVWAKSRSANNGISGVNQIVADLLGVEAPSGDGFTQKAWLREQLADFPKDKFQKLLDRMS